MAGLGCISCFGDDLFQSQSFSAPTFSPSSIDLGLFFSFAWDASAFISTWPPLKEAAERTCKSTKLVPENMFAGGAGFLSEVNFSSSVDLNGGG